MKASASILASMFMVAALGCGGAASSAMEPSATGGTHGSGSDGPTVAASAGHDPADLQVLMDRVFVHFQEVTGVALSAGDDCDLMASRLEAWGAEHETELAELAVEVRRIDRETQRKHLESKLESEPEFGMNFMIAVSTCQEHEGAKAAWKGLLHRLTR